MIEVTLPWPSSKLNPNARVHFREKAAQARTYREACHYLTLPEKRHLPDGDLRLELTFYPPDKRARDRDNLLSSMKSGLDGVAQALGIDDSRFEPVVVSVARQIGGMVKVRIVPRETLETV